MANVTLNDSFGIEQLNATSRIQRAATPNDVGVLLEAIGRGVECMLNIFCFTGKLRQ